MFRTSMAVSLITAFSIIAAFAQDARQYTCTGTMIEPSAMSQSPETVVLTLGPGQKIALDLGKGVVSVRRLRDNKIQLKFRTHIRNVRGEASRGLEKTRFYPRFALCVDTIRWKSAMVAK
jgi:hypothetical protein